MCLGVPGQIVEILDRDFQLAVAAVAGVRTNVHTGLLADVDVGDWVVIHVGFAMSKIDEAAAQEALLILRQMGQAYDDELAALADRRTT